MEIVKTFIISYNSTFDDLPLPETQIWLQGIDPFYAALLALAFLFTLLTVLLSLVQLYYIVKYISNHRIQTNFYFLVFMFPIAAVCNVSGMFIPRAAIFLYAFALVYLSVCLFAAISLLFNIFGGRKQMSEYCMKRNIPISFRITPLCCLSCLPYVPCTEKNLQRIECLVFQTPVLRTIIEVNSVVIFMELGHRHNLWFMLSQVLGIISLVVAFYGCYIMIPLAKSKLSPYRFNSLFNIIDITQCCYTIQKFCFDFGAALGLFSASYLLTPPAKAQFWSSFMLTFEMLLLSAITTYLMRPSQSLFFDKYISKSGEINQSVSFVSTAQYLETDRNINQDLAVVLRTKNLPFLS
ncbi:unnamed protein product [Cylicocyclus nassatus]|uniref:Uncharacterized protein n=1 Tax=Cylicocyclus nassatus TaxID=53992 RepID=A0AA36HCH4_CYLNA|nr:unnamed protein product [Cylicocyclus nassatus]